jgi:hypothetical protein
MCALELGFEYNLFEFDQILFKPQILKIRNPCYISLALWAQFPTASLLFFTRLVSPSGVFGTKYFLKLLFIK